MAPAPSAAATIASPSGFIRGTAEASRVAVDEGAGRLRRHEVADAVEHRQGRADADVAGALGDTTGVVVSGLPHTSETSQRRAASSSSYDSLIRATRTSRITPVAAR